MPFYFPTLRTEAFIYTADNIELLYSDNTSCQDKRKAQGQKHFKIITFEEK